MKVFTKYIVLFFVLFIFSCHNSTNNSGSKSEDNNDESNANDLPVFSSAVDQYGQLSVRGSKIVDKNGNDVQLRGMSFFWSQWMGQFYNKETVEWLKTDWQCNVIRAAMAVDATDGYISNPEIEKAKIFAVIDAAIKEGLYVIIDWHSHHAENYLEEAKSFFSEVAQKYGSYPNIIYETYNEPLDVSWTNVLKPYHEEVIAAIRAHDPDNLIICGTRTWSQRVDEVIGNKISDPNVVYTLHYYAATHKQPLRDLAIKAIAGDVPIFVTEYGVSEASGDGSINEIEANLWWNFLDENKISWCNWSIADKDELSAALKPNAASQGQWSDSDLTQSGTMVRNELKKKNVAY